MAKKNLPQRIRTGDGPGTVLLVLAEAGERETARGWLEEAGYEVLVEETGQPAVRLIDRRLDIDVVIADHTVCGGGNEANVLQAVTRSPQGLELILAGQADVFVVTQGIAAGGSAMEAFGGWPSILVVMAITTVMILLTELTSNTATAAAFLPVVGAVAIGIGQNPLLLTVPAALAASCAFMLPVATGPNVVVYGSGVITIPQMVRAGAMLNIAFVALITLATLLLMSLVFGPGTAVS